MDKPYQIEIIVNENGSKLHKIISSDSFNLEFFTKEGLLKIDFKKWRLDV